MEDNKEINAQSLMAEVSSQIAKHKTLKQLLQDVKINFQAEILPPQACLSIEDREVFTLGNFSLTIGKAKSRKTFFLVMVISAMLKDLTFGKFKSKLPIDQNQVYYFDTEQSEYHVQQLAQRICSLIGVPYPKNLHIYGLRKYNPAQRRKLIDYAITNNEGIGFVVIDGVRDIVTSINDEEQATEISSWFLRLTSEQNIHIATVLHQNKGDNNARGHLGTELVNKAETVLSITKDDQNNDISIVEAEYCRNIDPDPFAFEILDSLPVMFEDWQPTTNKSKKIDLDNIKEYEKYELLKEVFLFESEIKYKQLQVQLKLAFEKQFNKHIGNNKVGDLITYSRNKGWLIQSELRKPYTLGKYSID